MKTILLCLVVALCFCPLSPALAQRLQWERLPAFGTNPIHLTQSTPQGTLFAWSDSTALLRSADNGASWNRIITGFEPLRKNSSSANEITALAGQDSGLVAVVTRSQVLLRGIIRSATSGAAWMPFGWNQPYRADYSDGLNNSQFSGFTSDAGKFYAALTTSVSGSLYRSSDGGASWQELGNLARVTPNRSSSMMSVGVRGDTILCGLAFPQRTVLRSLDAGRTWDTASAMPNGGSPDRILVAKGYALASNGNSIMTSFDAGKTWQNRALSSQSIPNLSITAIAANDSTAFVGTTQGVFVSRDSGKTWQQENAGLANQRITALALTQTAAFVGTEAGMFRTSLVQGGTGVPLGFEPLNVGVFPNPAVSLISITASLRAASVVRVSLFSANGSSVFNRYESASAGDYRTEVDISHLPTGAYFVRMEAGATAWVEKIIKK